MARKFFFVCAGLFLLAFTYHMGATRAGAQAPLNQEVAMLSGELADGETIPLPHYADGTEAFESECRWLVSYFGPGDQTACIMGEIECRTEGRIVRSSLFTPTNCGSNSGIRLPGRANYLIIAVRNTILPTSARRQTWGSVKARSR